MFRREEMSRLQDFSLSSTRHSLLYYYSCSPVSPGFVLPINIRATPPLSPLPPPLPPCPLLILHLPSSLALSAAPLLKISQVTQNWREIWQGPQVVRIVEKSPTYRGNLLTSHTQGGEARSCPTPTCTRHRRAAAPCSPGPVKRGGLILEVVTVWMRSAH